MKKRIKKIVLNIQKNKIVYSILLFILFIIFFCAIIPFSFQKKEIMQTTVELPSDNVKLLSLLSDRINNEDTKEFLYNFVMQYFKNGGNIYEVYDYVNSHNELDFLHEAEALNPQVFDAIKQRELPFTYSDRGMYATLAYVEIIELHGYGGLAAKSTLFHEYAKMAYYKETIISDKINGRSLEYPNYSKKDVNEDVAKSLQFMALASTSVSTFVQNDFSIVTKYPENDVKALVQYAVGLRYLEAMNKISKQQNTSSKVFSFAIKYSHINAKKMYLYASLSNAVSLSYSKEVNKNEVRNAVYPFFSTYTAKQDVGIAKAVIDSKFTTSPSRFGDLGIYSYENIKLLASLVPEFKQWLISKGWNDVDF
jgi:hypothetical protein